MLARSGATEITFVTPQTEVAHEMNDYNSLIHTIRSLRQSKVRLFTYSWVKKIGVNGAKSVIVYDILTGEETTMIVDEVVFTPGGSRTMD